MKYTFLVLATFIGTLVSAQKEDFIRRNKEYPLDYYPKEATREYSYFKDIKNELIPYVGTWKYTYGNKHILLIINREKTLTDYHNGKNYYIDRLVGRYEVKDKTGRILETTLKSDFKNKDLMIQGGVIEPETSKRLMVFYGGKCNLGNGLIRLSKPSNNELSWTYFPQAIIVTNETKDQCKGEVYLPIGENLIFTKQ